MKKIVVVTLLSLLLAPQANAKQVAASAAVQSTGSEISSLPSFDLTKSKLPKRIIDGSKAPGREANDYLSFVLLGIEKAEMAKWLTGNFQIGEAFFGSSEHAEGEGFNSRGMTPLDYVALSSGQAGSVICVNESPKTYIFNEDTWKPDSISAIGLGESHVFETEQLNQDLFPKSDHIDRPYMAIDFAARSVEQLSLGSSFKEALNENREKLVDLVILNAIADAQLSVIAGHNKSLKRAVKVLKSACSDDKVLEEQYDKMFERPRRVTDSLARNQRIVKMNLDRASPKPFEFTNRTKDSADQDMFTIVEGANAEVLKTQYIQSGNGVLFFPSFEAALEARVPSTSAIINDYLVFFGKDVEPQNEVEAKKVANTQICGDKVYLVNRDAYSAQMGLDKSLIMQRGWLNNSYFPNDIGDRENLFYHVDFLNHMKDYLDFNFNQIRPATEDEEQRDLLILSALYDMQKAIYEDDSAAIAKSKLLLDSVCSDDAVRFFEASALSQDSDKVLKPLAEIENLLEDYEERDFKPVRFSSVKAEDVKNQIFSFVETGLEEPRMTRYYPTPGGTAVYPDIAMAAQAIQSIPLSITPTDYFVFFGKNMQGKTPEEKQAAANSEICSDKVYLIEEDGFKNDVGLDRMVVMQREWLDTKYYPESVGDRESGRYLGLDFMVEAKKYLDLKEFGEMNEEDIQRLIDLAIVNALYKIQEGLYLENRNQVEENQKILRNVCNDTEMQMAQRDLLANDRKRVLVPMDLIDRLIASHEDSEYTAFEFSTIVELKEKGALGIQSAANYAEIFGDALVKHYIGKANAGNVAAMNFYSEGHEPNEDGYRTFPILFVNGSAEGSPLCNIGYTYIVVPLMRPQFFILDVRKTEEINFDATTFEEAVGLEPGQGLNYRETNQRLVSEIMGYIFEARDKGVLGFDDPEKNSRVQAAYQMQMISNLYVNTAEELLGAEEVPEEVVTQGQILLGRMCSSEAQNFAIQLLTSIRDQETPPPVRERYASELTGDEIRVGDPGWTPPQSQVGVDTGGSKNAEGGGTAQPEVFTTERIFSEQPLVKAIADVFGSDKVKAFLVQPEQNGNRIFSAGFVSQGAGRTLAFPVLMLDDSILNESMCSLGNVYFLLPGVGDPSLFHLARYPKSELNLEAEHFSEIFGLQASDPLDISKLRSHVSASERIALEARDKGELQFEGDKERNLAIDSYVTTLNFMNWYQSHWDTIAKTGTLNDEQAQALKSVASEVCSEDKNVANVARARAFFRMIKTPDNIRAEYAHELTGNEIPIGNATGIRNIRVSGYVHALGSAMITGLDVPFSTQTKSFYFGSQIPKEVQQSARPINLLIANGSREDSPICETGYSYLLAPMLIAMSDGSGPVPLVVGVVDGMIDPEQEQLYQVLKLPEPIMSIDDLQADSVRELVSAVYEARDRGVTSFTEKDKQRKLIACATVFLLNGLNNQYAKAFEAPLSDNFTNGYRKMLGSFCGSESDKVMRSIYEQLPMTPPEVLEGYRDQLPADWVQPIFSEPATNQ